MGDPRRWDKVYASKPHDAVSWYESVPAVSLDVLSTAGFTPRHSLIDVGGGASGLVDAVYNAGCRDVTVLDLSGEALAAVRARLGEAEGVSLVAEDVARWRPTRVYDFWHDRAAFHFLTNANERAAYVAALEAALAPEGTAVVATFAPDGPETCSGLPVARYDAAGIVTALGQGFVLVAERRHVHTTPWGSAQPFTYAAVRRA